MQQAVHPLVVEAMKKAAVAWLAVPGTGPYPVWCLWLDGCLYVVSGPGEQPAPGLAAAAGTRPVEAATVTVRGDHGGRILTWPAAVGRVEPAGEEWDRVVPQLAAKRLNAPGAPGETAERWARECVVIRLVPAGDPIEARPERERQETGLPERDRQPTNGGTEIRPEATATT